MPGFARLIECPICRNENWSIVRGRFTCPAEAAHTPKMIIEAITRYHRGMITSKRKIAFVADWTGPNAVYRLDARVVTLLYANGAKFVIRLVENEQLSERYVEVNGMRVSELLGRSGQMFLQLTNLSVAEFDGELAERLTGGRLTAGLPT